MPLAQVSGVEDPAGFLGQVCFLLPTWVSETLGIPGDEHASLAERDVAVWFHPRHKLDRQAQDVLIVVDANYYPQREPLVSGSAEAIWMRAKSILSRKTLGKVLTIGVWVRVGNLSDWYEDPKSSSD